MLLSTLALALPQVDLTPVHQQLPVYPELEEPPETDIVCIAHVQVHARGLPVKVEVSDCPEVFHEPTVDAALDWRFEPLGEMAIARIEIVFQAWRPPPEVETLPSRAVVCHVPVATDGRPLTVAQRVYPTYPLHAGASGSASCEVAVDVAADGRPIDAIVSGCPEPFHSQLIYSFLQWRWEPLAAPATARLTVDLHPVGVRFRPDFLDAPPPEPVLAARPSPRHPTVAADQDIAQPTYMVPPEWPRRRRRPERCRVRVRVDGVGEPERIQVDRCTRPFQEAAREAVAQWRWPATGGAFTTVVSLPIGPAKQRAEVD